MYHSVKFGTRTVQYLFTSVSAGLARATNGADVVYITDENIYNHYPSLFAGTKHIVLNAGEQHKTMHTAEQIARQLIELEATRNTMLVGIGGGVVTDITGFVASVYMRGVTFGFVPTTLLAMVDAAIGGKNGVNSGLHKNITGTITQPAFILFDHAFLSTLPHNEWVNGFAEIIKYGCITDKSLFARLQQSSVQQYMQQPEQLWPVIEQCIHHKNTIVAADEHETGQRKLLNFGHTAAHAIENLYGLSHGCAVAIGMVIAARLSVSQGLLSSESVPQLIDLLQLYGLPTTHPMDVPRVMEVLKMDKKRSKNTIDYILLEDIGRAVIRPLTFDVIEQALTLCTQP